jgi:gluconokinase
VSGTLRASGAIKHSGKTMVIVFTGVSGAGKTTVGKLMAETLDWPFYDADNYHPPANIAKMSAGVALIDEDRVAWLESLRNLIRSVSARGENAILACSALKHAYREVMRSAGEVRCVLLHADERLIRERLKTRQGHFMNPTLIDSQFETLEEPQSAIVLDAALPPSELVRQACVAVGI